MSGHILYENILQDGTLSASSAETANPKENAIDWLTSDWWKPSATGNANLSVALTDAANADSIGVAGHTLGANGARVALEYSTDAGTTWTQHGTLMAPVTSETVMMYAGSTQSAADWRAKFYAKQNLLTYSQELDNAAWTLAANTEDNGAVSDPFGGSNGREFESIIAAGSTSVSQALSGLTAGTDYVASLWIRSPVPGNVNSGNILSVITDGVVYEITAASSGLSTEYQRFEISFNTGTATTATFYVGFDWTVGGILQVYGAQVEEAPSAGEYQVTTSAAVINSVGYVGQVSIGAQMAIPNGPETGYNPPTLSPDDKILNNKSDGGQFIGRSYINTGESFTIPFRYLEPSWVRDTWSGFAAHGKLKPFFYAWDYTNYPLEVSYCWSDGKWPSVSYSHVNLMEVSLNVKGIG